MTTQPKQLHPDPCGNNPDQAMLADLFALLAERGRKIRQARSDAETADGRAGAAASGQLEVPPLAE